MAAILNCSINLVPPLESSQKSIIMIYVWKSWKSHSKHEIVENVHSPIRKQLLRGHFKSENQSNSTVIIVLQKYLNNIYLKKSKIPLLTDESRKRKLANQKTAINRPLSYIKWYGFENIFSNQLKNSWACWQVLTVHCYTC